MKSIALALLAILLLGGTACGGGDAEFTLEEKQALACDNMICWENAGPFRCDTIYRLVVHSEGCLDSIIGEDDCSWLYPPYSSYAVDICYPPCSDKPTRCSGCQLRECLNGRLRIVNCPALCTEMDRAYLGCGDRLGADACLCSDE